MRLSLSITSSPNISKGNFLCVKIILNIDLTYFNDLDKKHLFSILWLLFGVIDV